MTKLHPDLERYVRTGPMGEMIHHPLLIMIVYNQNMNDIVNHQYVQKKEAVEKAKMNGEYHSYIFLHERPYRINALMQVVTRLETNAEMQEMVESVYTDSENIWESHDDWRFVLEYYAISNYESRDETEITIYRGYNYEESKLSFSWTESLETAQWFANRYLTGDETGKVVKAKVKVKDILFKYDGRNEKEVVVLPDDVFDIEDL